MASAKTILIGNFPVFILWIRPRTETGVLSQDSAFFAEEGYVPPAWPAPVPPNAETIAVSLQLRNAFLRGWFAARSQRQPPQPDGMAEKVYLEIGFDAGTKSAGSALPLLAPVDLNELRAAWDMEFHLGILRLQKRYPEAVMPGSGRPFLDLDLRESAVTAAEETAAEVEAAAAAESQPKSRWDDDDDGAPKANRFLPTRNYGSSMGRGRVRLKG